MRSFIKILLGIVASFTLLLRPISLSAQAPSEAIHLTTVIMQLRGNECCSPGNPQAVQQWLSTSRELNLPLTIAVRYDALQDESYQQLLVQAVNDGHELAGYLEITPSLAMKSQVSYRGNDKNWYQANHAFLLGYSQEERKRIIDSYMRSFRETTGRYPTTTVAWMIDAFSLRYLAENYGVTVHEITREQLGVDSYSLHGGPAHYPYIPSENWALIPADSTQTTQMPLIVRQTVTDPVWNYGDTTSSYTSQPNDYDLASRGLEYFRFLFTQAHSQPEPITFTLLGLENSMPGKDQAEFLRQLEVVSSWRDINSTNRVILAQELPSHWKNRNTIQVYAGSDMDTGKESQAWWIGTSKYRARVRFDNNTLFLTDIRIYDQSWKDPYWDTSATGGAYWIIPFVLDGARFFANGSAEPINWNDTLLERKGQLPPTRIVLAENLPVEKLQVERQEDKILFTKEGQLIATFHPHSFSLHEQASRYLSHPQLERAVQNLQWRSSSGQLLWEAKPETTANNETLFTPRSYVQDLNAEREDRYFLLHPEIRERPLSPEKSRLDVMNRYSMIGRNPVRLAFWLKDAEQYPTKASREPTVTTDSAEVETSISSQQLPQGYIFIDFSNQEPGEVLATVEYQGFSQSESIYFVPNCRQEILACIQRPIDAWRFLQLKLEERRIVREKQ